AYTALAEALGQFLAVRSSTVHVAVVSGLGHAAVAYLTHVGLGACCGVSNEHTEAGLEGGNLGRRIGRWYIVHRDAAVGAETLAHELGHAPVRSIAGSEVQDRGPVVREILAEGAARTRRVCDEIVIRRVHGTVERVPSDDLVKMRRRYQ